MAKIVVQNVSKAYKVYRTRFSRLLEWFSPTNSIRHDKKWILKDINFVVQPGEAVGIIGINGAGKVLFLSSSLVRLNLRQVR